MQGFQPPSPTQPGASHASTSTFNPLNQPSVPDSRPLIQRHWKGPQFPIACFEGLMQTAEEEISQNIDKNRVKFSELEQHFKDVLDDMTAKEVVITSKIGCHYVKYVTPTDTFTLPLPSNMLVLQAAHTQNAPHNSVKATISECASLSREFNALVFALAERINAEMKIISCWNRDWFFTKTPEKYRPGDDFIAAFGPLCQLIQAEKVFSGIEFLNEFSQALLESPIKSTLRVTEEFFSYLGNELYSLYLLKIIVCLSQGRLRIPQDPRCIRLCTVHASEVFGQEYRYQPLPCHVCEGHLTVEQVKEAPHCLVFPTKPYYPTQRVPNKYAFEVATEFNLSHPEKPLTLKDVFFCTELEVAVSAVAKVLIELFNHCSHSGVETTVALANQLSADNKSTLLKLMLGRKMTSEKFMEEFLQIHFNYTY